MTFQVHELRKATTDKRHIFTWLIEGSPSGAAAWLSAYDEMVERLKTDAATFAETHENPELDQDVKQALFKTRRGRIYRALFLIEADESLSCGYAVRGKPPIQTDDIE